MKKHRKIKSVVNNHWRRRRRRRRKKIARVLSPKSFMYGYIDTQGRKLISTSWPIWLIKSRSADFGGCGILLLFFFPKSSTELDLKISSSLVLLIGTVPSGHLPFKCHNWVIGGFLSAFPFPLVNLLSSNTWPSGWKLGLICIQIKKTPNQKLHRQLKTETTWQTNWTHFYPLNIKLNPENNLNCMVFKQRVIERRLARQMNTVDDIPIWALPQKRYTTLTQASITTNSIKSSKKNIKKKKKPRRKRRSN